MAAIEMINRVDLPLELVSRHSTLCLDVGNPGWENTRGFLFDPGSNTLYFPVSKKYLADRNLDRYEVLIWSQPRVLVVGRLLPASDEDVDAQTRLAAAQGRTPDQIDLLLFDQRHHKPRRDRYKLLVESVREMSPAAASHRNESRDA